MAEVFIRRTTAVLLAVIAMLTLGFIALLVMRVVPEGEPYSDKKFPPWSVEKFRESQSYETSGVTNKIIAKKPTKTKMNEASALTTSSERNSAMEPWEKNIRIPVTTIPLHYDLMLFPNLETGTFTGKVATTIGVTEPMDYLVTHIKLMNITSTKLLDPSGREVELQDFFEYEPNQFWVVRPKVALEVGNYTLALDFNGGLRGHIVGFYMSEYSTSSGEKRAIATSKFQPTDARRAFPCFDEPSFKSTFKTTLIRPSQGYIALSNMPVEKETPDSPLPGFTKVEFEKSVPMVTYLACFIVCDFEHVEVLTNEQKPFRVYATKDQIDRAHYARDIGVDILNFYEKYFEVEYPLPKQDMIAIPDFVSGAMEHWGLITYRETSLLYDNVNSSSFNKQRVATVVAHELAHMWFGNLVTLKWWDDLWLNEGFASYIEYKGVAHHEKDWDMLEQFVVDEVQSVFSLDEILSSHPIVQPVNHPDEITEIFDAISYSKGSSVLRMLENFIGPENFRIGVRNFLRRFKYGNAVTQDLWDDLQGTLKEDLNITRIMDTWTRQMGFPVVNVKVSANDENQLEITQQRFLIDPDAKSKDDSPYQYKWDIPISYKTESVPRSQVWLKMEQNKLLINRPSESSWIKFNVDQYGYYRVNYDAKLWQQLIQLLKTNHEALSPSDRSSLIDDGFSLAAAKHISYETAFQVISYMKSEKHYIPWSAAYSHITDIGLLLQFTKAYASYRKFVVGLVADHVDRVGWEDTGSHTERRNRILILKLACLYGHKKCVEGAVQKFTSWIKDPSVHIPANFRSIVYKYGIKETGEEEWNELMKRFLAELNAQEKMTMLTGLTSSKEPWIINRFLDMGKNESVIRQQDFFTILNYLSIDPAALPHVWNFIRENWQWMVDRFGLNNRYLGQMVRNVAYKFTVPLQLTELQEFFAKYPKAGAGKRSREQALERVQQNIKWIENFSKTLHMWLLGETKV